MNKLGRKQRISNADWMAAAKNIELAISQQDLDGLVERTASEVREKAAGKKAAFAWSGGKDSLVLERICQMVDIEACVLVICDLEYPTFMEWVEEHKPAKLEIINTGQTLEWLAAHPHMLFPQNSKTAAQWFNIVQHRGQTRYYKENDLDMLLLGRRKADGNYVGKGSNIYTNGQGVTRYSPLSDWTHEQILAFIHYYEIELPPFYEWKNGYSCGTHPWASRPRTGSIENGWKEVYEIDQSILVAAAKHIPSAKAFLDAL